MTRVAGYDRGAWGSSGGSVGASRGWSAGRWSRSGVGGLSLRDLPNRPISFINFIASSPVCERETSRPATTVHVGRRSTTTSRRAAVCLGDLRSGRWRLCPVAFDPLVVLRRGLPLQLVGGGSLGSSQRAGRRSTHAAQAIEDAAQAIHAESVQSSTTTIRGSSLAWGKERGNDQGCGVPCLRRSK